MQPLFTTSLIIGGRPSEYHVFFNDGAYHLKAGGKQEIILERANDEWHLISGSEEEGAQATSALDKYLLSQH